MIVPALLAGVLGASCVQPPPSDEARGEPLRPVLSGPEQTVESDDRFFVVHWTEEGVDQLADLGDDDANGIPDGVDRILVGLNEGAAAYLAAGWEPIVPDGGGGGTDGIDVYVRQIDAFGYAYQEYVGDRASCYMALDPDNTNLGGQIAESVAAHEAHHCVQYAYTTTASSWIYEATSTYEQYLLFSDPALELALGVLWNQRLRGMASPIDRVGGRFEYAGFLLLKYFADRGGPGTPVELWEALAVEPDWEQAFEQLSEASFDEPWDETYATWGEWNLFACGRDDANHYDPATHPCTLDGVQVEVPDEQPDDVLEMVHESGRYATLYAQLDAGGDPDPLELACRIDGDDARARVLLVAIDSTGRGGEVAGSTAEGGDVLEVRLLAEVDPAGSFGVVGASLGAEPATIRCGFARVPPFEEPGDDCGCAQSSERPVARSLLLLLLLLISRRPCRTSPGCDASAGRP